MNTRDELKLAAPGAGLPKGELVVARLLFALRQRTGTPRSFNARFLKERALIRTLLVPCNHESGAYRVLIRRLPGLEDSSRYWSVWMTLDHLRIVNCELARVIGALTNGIVPKGQASTAAVKPSQVVTVDVIANFEKSCDALLATVAAAPDLNTEARFSHPWFGPLNAAGWHALAGIHMGIHRVQIERILKGLPSSNSPN